MDYTLAEARVREGQLLQKAIAGDVGAFGDLYGSYLDGIYRYLYLQVGSESETEALVEKVFARVWKMLPDYTGGAATFEAWLYWVARKKVVEWADQEEHRRGRFDDQVQLPQAASGQEQLIDALAILSEMEKQVVLLRLVENLTYGQVSQVLRRSEGACQLMQQWAVNALHHHLLSQLQAPRLKGWPEGREEVLSMCIEQIVPGTLTFDECIGMFPRWELEIKGLRPLIAMFHRAQAIHPADQFAATGWQRLARRLPPRPKPPVLETGQKTITDSFGLPVRPRRVWSLVLALVAVLLLTSLVAGVGVVRAADDAIPGDLLYRLDRALEQRTLARISDPTVATVHRLQYAEERVAELETLAARGGDAAAIQTALDDYGVQIGTLLVDAGARPGDESTVAQVISEALAEQGARLDAVLLPDPAIAQAIASAAGCAPENQLQLRPATRAVAAAFTVADGSVAGWRCAGYTFGDIVIALETSRRTAVPAERLLARKAFTAGWGDVWHALKAGTDGELAEPANQVDQTNGRSEEQAGRAGTAPGRADQPPGRRGQAGNPPGQGNQPPGRANNPPGQSNQPPGQAGNPPGQSNQPAGQSGNPPGQSNQPAGQGNQPAQSNQPAGQSGNPPGQSNQPPGQGNQAPGQGGQPPGRGGD